MIYHTGTSPVSWFDASLVDHRRYLPTQPYADTDHVRRYLHLSNAPANQHGIVAADIAAKYSAICLHSATTQNTLHNQIKAANPNCDVGFYTNLLYATETGNEVSLFTAAECRTNGWLALESGAEITNPWGTTAKMVNLGASGVKEAGATRLINLFAAAKTAGSTHDMDFVFLDDVNARFSGLGANEAPDGYASYLNWTYDALIPFLEYVSQQLWNRRVEFSISNLGDWTAQGSLLDDVGTASGGGFNEFATNYGDRIAHTNDNIIKVYNSVRGAAERGERIVLMTPCLTSTDTQTALYGWCFANIVGEPHSTYHALSEQHYYGHDIEVPEHDIILGPALEDPQINGRLFSREFQRGTLYANTGSSSVTLPDSSSLGALSGKMYLSGSEYDKTGLAVMGIGPSGAVFTKTGAGALVFTGSGTEVNQSSELGLGVAARQGSGLDSVTNSELGSGITPRVASGARSLLFTKTGAAITARTASGTDSHTRSAIGAGVTGLATSGTDVTQSSETGSGIAAHIGSGADATTYSETGLAESARVASGAKIISIDKVGAAISAQVASGTDAVTKNVTGSGIVGRVASGARQTTASESASGVTERAAQGADTTTYSELGTGVSARVASGVSSVVASNTYDKTGVAVLGRMPFHKTGVAIVGREGSGSKIVITPYVKVGTAIMARTGSGAKTLNQGTEYNKSGGGAGGAGTPTYGLLSLSIPGGLKASGTKTVGTGGTTYTKVGAAITPQAASGSRAMEMSRSGSSTKPRTASGLDTIQFTESGLAIKVTQSSGVDSNQSSESGSAIRAHQASGVDQPTYNERNTVEVPYVGSGDKTNTYVERGTGALDLVTQGTGYLAGQAATGGTGLLVLTSSGADASIDVNAGQATSVQSASGTRSMEYLKVGRAEIGFVANAGRQTERQRSGGGTNVWVSTGADAFNGTKSSLASVEFTAKGLRSFTKAFAGQGALGLSASGVRSSSVAIPPPLRKVARVRGFVGGSKIKSWSGRRRINY